MRAPSPKAALETTASGESLGRCSEKKQTSSLIATRLLVGSTSMNWQG